VFTGMGVFEVVALQLGCTRARVAHPHTVPLQRSLPPPQDEPICTRERFAYNR
jgi:hypothetical protein